MIIPHSCLSPLSVCFLYESSLSGHSSLSQRSQVEIQNPTKHKTQKQLSIFFYVIWVILDHMAIYDSNSNSFPALIYILAIWNARRNRLCL